MDQDTLYQLLLHAALVGVSGLAVYKLTDWVSYGFWLFRGLEVPGRAKAGIAWVLGLTLPPAAYAILLVDSGLVRFEFSSLVAVTGAAFMTSWGVYQRSKYKKHAGEVIYQEPEIETKGSITK